ncbi:fatty-acyl-CoA synthase [Salsuginibacillus halophilus]|uniref:Fatty-acyl-CoA synthase n=1 Tax=Salsuginibacillus halophilus TaxID=517424 RepID=A0A2P8HQH9_9BACI|nr:long-chain fatty acid--CoA ligase [Salsuginibacillus halophilus]PSL48444.1 fatty-acyl-CoA synthase [Salsuginibacillus halophilus]
MMNVPLNVPAMMERAAELYSKKEVVSRTLTGVQRLNYEEIAGRTKKLAGQLQALGVRQGDRVGTIAWNHHRHLESYFAIPGAGGVLHTINLRLSPEHLRYVINHAEDKLLLIDEDLLPLIEPIQDQLSTVEGYIVMSDTKEYSTTLSPVYDYETLIENGDAHFSLLTDVSEEAPAGICYTSATTGNPKGVVYSHRAIALHSYALGLADTAALSERDRCMPVVPMFHANAWGLPFAATWFGTTQVLPGPQFTPDLLAELIEQENVTLTAGVPTIWMGLLQAWEKGNYDTSSLRAVLCGGSAAPAAMIEAFEVKYNVPFLHAYGMTETSPLASVATLKSYQYDLPKEEQLEIRATQGLPAPGVEMKVVNADGDVAWGSGEMGELLIRGPWIADEYDQDERSAEAFQDGWLYTGDVATRDEEGNIRLVDRTKDLVKSGGEWISSVDLENAIMAHDGVLEAAVIAVPHPDWQERPVACVVKKEGFEALRDQDILDSIRPQFAKWWLPDDVVFLDELPKTSVGKFLKRSLREQFSEHLMKA